MYITAPFTTAKTWKQSKCPSTKERITKMWYICTKEFFFLPFRATPAAYESAQASGQIRAAAAGIHHSHRHSGSKLHP